VKDLHCCYQLSVQGGGTQNADYGDGTGEYPYYKGNYRVHWQFAYRILVKFVPSSHTLFAVSPDYNFTVQGHPDDVLHEWTASWAFQDNPENVQEACCYTQNPHGWKPACDSQNANIDSNGFVDKIEPSP